jgi:O-antigen/teichoic acid export membrane protein
VLILLAMAGARWLPNQSADAARGLQIYSLALLPLAFFSVFTTALRGKQRMDAYMLANLAASFLQAAAVALFVRPGGSVAGLAGVLLAAQAAGALISGVICATRLPGFLRIWRFSAREVARLARASAPMALIALIGILYQKLSVPMVSTLDGPAVTGWFSAALRAVEASKTVHLAVFTALYPAMAQAANAALAKPSAEQTNENLTGAGFWKGSLGRHGKLLLGGALLAALGLCLLAAPVTLLLYGEEYAPAIQALRILAWILVPFTANTFLSLSFLAARRERTVMRVQLIGLGTLAVLNAWWIAQWGLVGACLASVAAESVQSAAYFIPWIAGRVHVDRVITKNMPGTQ